MRGDKPKTPRPEADPPQNAWVTAAGGMALVIVSFAWVTLSNLTWFLFFPLLAVAFVPLLWLARRHFAAETRAGATPAMQAFAALVATVPLALALVAPTELVNRLGLTGAGPAKARVLNVERKEDWFGRGSRKFHYYTLKLDEAAREIVLHGPEEKPRFSSGETVSICGYRGLLGLAAYGLPPCTQTFQLE